MDFHQPAAQVFIPDGKPLEEALRRTTHLAVSAHQDDIEIMAAGPIVQCFQQEALWFTAVVMTDGRGSPRDGLYKEYTDDAMRQVRIYEQMKAATIGEYSALIMLDYQSKQIKDGVNRQSVEDLAQIMKICQPESVYTHNLADKHDTHVAVAFRLIEAIRSLPASERPRELYGCEVWRDLDWMMDEDKVAFDLTLHENLQMALLGVFDSQISGGKRYDLATMGRRRANATYFESHGVDITQGLSYGMNLTPLILDPQKEINFYVNEYIQRFKQDVEMRLKRVGNPHQ